MLLPIDFCEAATSRAEVCEAVVCEATVGCLGWPHEGAIDHSYVSPYRDLSFRSCGALHICTSLPRFFLRSLLPTRGHFGFQRKARAPQRAVL